MNEVTTPLTLQEKVAERIKAQIGELLEPEDLKRLVDRAMEEAFFKRPTKTDGYGRSVGFGLPPIVETVEKLLKPIVEEQVAAWCRANDENVRKLLDEIIRDGIVKIYAQVLDAKMQSDLWTFGNALSQRLVGKPL